ncbi:MAG: elongation factor P maturation arginine rhamnosyltransferase EarP [Alcaligenaceae bacterium]|nr:elongation factor P maturation arginine rhamnosyltransferase EarP [Alcaligenaceae bacterium]
MTWIFQVSSSINTPCLASIDIFCKVIDNFGDIGVCWRLARDLATHGQAHIRLWVDDLPSFKKIAPQLNVALDKQDIQGIQIQHWGNEIPAATEAADIVIEAFACDPPAAYIKLMPHKTRLWLNLEYLSAEPWVESFHAQPSLQNNGIVKYFFFPGFTEKTGGLLREKNLLQERDQWQSSHPAQKTFLQPYLNEAQILLWEQGAPVINLFCYPSAPLEELLGALINAAQPVLLLVPEGVAPTLETQLASQLKAPGTHKEPPFSDLYIIRLPFIEQSQYDRLLWLGDLNFIRGEDSFVRAIWAGKPFIWHIYEQEANTHLIKLDAWLSSSKTSLPVASLMRAWNKADTSLSFAALLQTNFFNHENRKKWEAESLDYCQNLSKNNTLSVSILKIYQQMAQKV